MEEWEKIILGIWEGYEISNMGRIRRYGRILTTQLDKDGYEVITLSQNQKKKLVKIHRLVAQYFIQNPKELNIVNHIDGNKRNNLYTNLEWTTVKENTQHAFDNGLVFKSKVYVEYQDGKVEEYPTVKLASAGSGLGYRTILALINGIPGYDGSRTLNKLKIKKVYRKGI